MQTALVWDPALLGYNLGEHPLDPVRVELTIALARELGVLDRDGVELVVPAPAPEEALLRVHSAEYLTAVQTAPHDPFWSGFGLNTPDNPTFDHMHEASSLVCGGSIAAVEAVWSGRTQRAANIAGGLHHAMRSSASGFCVYNDVAVAIARLLDMGAERLAYVDLDVHHGDGVQAAFYDDPRVMTISLHETPLALFPGTGFSEEIGTSGAEGTAVNVPLPPGAGDAEWLRAFHAVVPSLLRAYQPQLLLTQCGCDTHAVDPLADLRLSVDGQRASYLALEKLAEELTGGRWVCFGGGGYGVVSVVPRAWTHLLATLTGQPLDVTIETPDRWRAFAAERRPSARVPLAMTDGGNTEFTPWQRGGDSVDRAVLATRRAVFPLHGLDPDDPRD
ncbi:acetoin utilization protein AcuC [Fodinicola feengrottensis]|uniref:Acetoin utilization protein AcuC n=1 Tax=Fodinicola feengrottensis TaxID=435914 RepID=A0ABN2J4Q3_9ACTN